MRARNAHRPAAHFARQAIVGRDRNTVAYELLFRDQVDQEHAAVTDDVQATNSVIEHGCFRLGLRRAVGSASAFINMNGESLAAASTESLPRAQVVLEVLESVSISAALIDRCRQLKACGFRLALDDVANYEESHRPLLELVDFIKVDIPMLDPARLNGLVEKLKQHPAKLLAEKVDTEHRARECWALGFDLFQGHYFGRPQLVVG